MKVVEALDREVARRNLLEHPFYQAWSAGTLPTTALATYAAEYGAFIGVVADGWETLGEHAHAAEERHHTALWQQFARHLGTRVGAATLPGVAALVTEATRCFADSAEAAGALYAFERQQPATAASKLTGLRAWYALPAEAEAYFHAHAGNDYEANMLAAHANALGAGAQQRAIAACGRVADALWDALTAVQMENPEVC